jgi:adenosylhomocysteine nucleosidase
VVSETPVLLIVAADSREFAGFEPLRWSLKPAEIGIRWAAAGRLEGVPVLLAANGPGKQNALAALEQACAARAVAAVVSTGFAGGLAPSLEAGDLFLAESVLEFSAGVEYSVRLPECAEPAAYGRLLTVDSVAQDAAAKARLRETGADAVDMEAAALARGAQARQLPFYCVRAISDDARTSFEVDFNAARRPDGTFSGWRIAAQAGLSRRRWRQLMDLKRVGEQASRNLAAFFERCSFTH